MSTLPVGSNTSMQARNIYFGRDSNRRLPKVVLKLLELDFILLMATILMAILGVVMVFSATRNGLRLAGISQYYWTKRDMEFLAVGFLIMMILAFSDYHRLERIWRLIVGGLLFSLLIVMIPHVGQQKLGSQRWLQLGPLQFQPSAFAGICIAIAGAAMLANKDKGLSWIDIAKVLALTALVMVIVAKQPDLGSAIVVGVLMAIMIVVAGARVRQLIILAVLSTACVVLIIKLGLLHGYQMQRLTSFLHPHKGTNSVNYNLTQSKIDIGSGGLFGKGLFKDQQTNLQYVPEQQTDFIFTAIGGQLGFVGGASVIALYWVIALRLLAAARRSIDRFGMLIATAAFALFTFSAFQNAGMTIGIMPITGIPLPLISYGGSADFAFLIAIGLSLSVSRISRVQGQTSSSANLISGVRIG